MRVAYQDGSASQQVLKQVDAPIKLTLDLLTPCACPRRTSTLYQPGASQQVLEQAVQQRVLGQLRAQLTLLLLCTDGRSTPFPKAPRQAVGRRSPSVLAMHGSGSLAPSARTDSQTTAEGTGVHRRRFKVSDRQQI